MRSIVIHAPHDLRVEDAGFAAGEVTPDAVRIRMAAGGICGSDLHYFHNGGFGTVRIKEPMALGHEASGIVEAVGSAVTGVRVGDLVAVNPSVPCDECSFCKAGMRNHCTDMRFNGSAMRFPHVQGMFRECMVVDADRALVMPKGVKAEEAALCEPFAVSLHAVKQAGDLKGKTVLVSGCGPIGVLVIVAAKLAGAAQIIATDITPHSLAMAERFGASTAINVSAGAAALAPYAEGKGSVDAVFECSGNPHAIAGAISVLKPRGRMVLVGLGGDSPMPMNTIVAKELSICGTFRFDHEFAEAAALIGSRKVDLGPLISAVYPMDKAVEAFHHASDRTRATKVAIALAPTGSPT